MPIYDEFKDMIKGEEADLKNTGGKNAGCITAGAFIGEFVGNTPWIHMDIAGTSTSSKSIGYKAKGLQENLLEHYTIWQKSKNNYKYNL